MSNGNSGNSSDTLRVLQVHASGRRGASVSRNLSDDVVNALSLRHGRRRRTNKTFETRLD
jgi:hypothetical protein